jgi:hypothetical protein
VNRLQTSCTLQADEWPRLGSHFRSRSPESGVASIFLSGLGDDHDGSSQYRNPVLVWGKEYV